MQLDELLAVVDPVLTACGLEIDRAEIRSAGRRKLVQLFLDGDGESGHGPSLDEIAEATKDISKALDESGVAGNAPYTLEVSSRGVSRPLTEPKHFRRNAGRLVEFILQPEAATAAGLDAKVAPGGVVVARIVAADEQSVRAEIPAAGKVPARELSLGYSGIAKAVVQVEMNRPAPGEEG
jgi:ribosome maturation factor RimP